jgi:hypothetical protein
MATNRALEKCEFCPSSRKEPYPSVRFLRYVLNQPTFSPHHGRMAEKDLYILGIVEDGKEVLLVYKATHEEAEQHGRQMVEAEQKQGINAEMKIIKRRVPESTFNACIDQGRLNLAHAR